MQSFKQHLQEKLLVINKGAKEGQVVFLAGGAGSGKGFALKHFMEDSKFKVLNVDDWKELYLKIPQRYPELKNMDLRNPKDVFALHTFVKQKGIKTKATQALFKSAATGTVQPNILFDVTMKDTDEIDAFVPRLLDIGYKKENIHVVWILSEYEIAVQQNAGRPRVVPDDILLKTHEGVANVMYNMVFKGKYPYSIMNGGVWVILGGKNHTVLYNPDTASKSGNFVIKDFKYLTVKEPRKKIDTGAVQSQLYQWIISSIPKTKATKDIWKATKK